MKIIGMVKTIPVLKYVHQEIFTPFSDRTCNHTNVANDPIGVIFGPKSEPMTFAKINESRITPVVLVSAIAKALIITVGKLFITEESIAAKNPIPIVEINNPSSEKNWINLAN